MGSQASHFVGSEHPVQNFDDNYTLYNNTELEDAGDNSDKVSMFITTQYKQGCALEINANKLKQYRHPAILHFTSWTVHSKVACLETERVVPLSLSCVAQEEEECLCLGLMEIFQAVDFLHSRVGVAHGNITLSSIFINHQGRWKLGSLENLAAASETNVAKDIQALGLVVSEILTNCEQKQSLAFRDFAKNTLLLPDIKRIPSSSSILNQDYFQQDFCKIFIFLKEFPVQSQTDKLDFFKTATYKLKNISPLFVAKCLLPSLLSRYIMMEDTAKKYLTSNLLIPKPDDHQSAPADIDPILPVSLFQSYVVPQLKTLFMVPDTNIRLYLLHLLPHFVSYIDHEQLEQVFLPYILQGMRDTNISIVSSTLRVLADLVPILGPEVVVGKNRSKIFSDSSPHKTSNVTEPVTVSNKSFYKDKEAVEEKTAADDEWENWNDEDQEETYDETTTSQDSCKDTVIESPNKDYASNVDKIIKNVMELDILKLDVKVSKVKNDKETDEMDYFADMTPNIEVRNAVELDTSASHEAINIQSSDMFSASVNDDEADGWGDDDEDW